MKHLASSQNRKAAIGFLTISVALNILFTNCTPALTYDETSSASTTSSVNAIQVLSYPASQQIAFGQALSLSVSAYSSSGLSLTYQWYKAGVILSGATSNTLSIWSATSNDEATYYLRISDGTNVTVSPSFYVQVGTTGSTITFSSSPSSQTVALGGITRFEITASSSNGAALSYQWLKNGVAIGGQNGSEMYITSTASGDAGYYAVVVSDGTTSVKSATALLTVTATTASCSAIGGTLYNSHCYIVNRTASTWAAAESTCVSAGGHLATITTTAENYFVYSITQTSVWIGASDSISEGSFVWRDGTAVSFSAWASGEPNNSSSDEDCVEMTPTGYWNDLSCSIARSFVCEI